MRASERRPWSAGGLFAAYAAVTLVPVLVLGLVLTQLLRAQEDDSGKNAGVAQARLLARAVVAPSLDGHATSMLTPGEYARLRHNLDAAVSERQVLRLRVRDLSGRIVFPRDSADEDSQVDDDALDAARGETVARLTHLNADESGSDPGPRVVEVYLPLVAQQTNQRIGVLEMYLPYAQIASAISARQRSMFITLLAGLGLLWLCLIGVTASVIRHLRREIAANAYLADHDVLTGLANRTRLRQRLTRLTSGSDEPLVLAEFNINRFRQLTDTLGPANGDSVLKTIAQRLREFAGPGGYLARLSGGDFAVLGRIAPDEVPDWLSRLRTCMREPLEIDGVPLAVDITIGYEFRADGSMDADTLLAHAAVALTAAKRGVTTTVTRYAPELELHNATALTLVAEIGAAIERDELVLHFQPKYDVPHGRLSSVEALVRWQHPARGLLFPDSFIGAVEETELIDDLTAWVLRQACRAAMSLEPSVRVAVNVSARSLAQPDFAADVIDVVRAEAVPSSRIILEVTETAVITDPRRARRTLMKLRESGFAISIDDFGAGQTSLSQLVDMPLDELKIDRTFVGDMLENARSAAVVHAVIQLGHSLGISVTAEGVESESILCSLRDLGCDVAQGYHFSRPVPLDELMQLLREPVPAGRRNLAAPLA